MELQKNVSISIEEAMSNAFKIRDCWIMQTRTLRRQLNDTWQVTEMKLLQPAKHLDRDKRPRSHSRQTRETRKRVYKSFDSKVAECDRERNKDNALRVAAEVWDVLHQLSEEYQSGSYVRGDFAL